jgi:hypothetical protein
MKCTRSFWVSERYAVASEADHVCAAGGGGHLCVGGGGETAAVRTVFSQHGRLPCLCHWGQERENARETFYAESKFAFVTMFLMFSLR